MYAIVDIAGQQFKVEKDQKIYVHRLEGQEGTQVTFDKVLLIDNDGDVKVGDPLVSGVSISAKILSHLKGDKVLVFKKKRRKGYQKLNGHRQFFTHVQIEDILGVGEPNVKKATRAKKSTKKIEATPELESAEPKVLKTRKSKSNGT
jgi:large subunit ribosomal protein L21